MIKSRLGDGAVLVGFELPAAVSATSVSLCGDFNDWSPEQHPLTLASDGTFVTFVPLPAGRPWRFRYLLDGERWENDWAADAYISNGLGGEDSVVDLTDVSQLPMTATVSGELKDRTTLEAAADGVDDAAVNGAARPVRSSGWFRRLIRRPA